MSKDEIQEPQLQKTIHLKLQVWAKDKDTGLVPAFIVPSFHFEPEQIKEFDKDGLFDQAYDAFRTFCLLKQPNLNFIGETKDA